MGGHPGAAGGLRPDASGMEAYPGVWGQHRGVVCYAGVADAKPEKALLVSPIVDMEKLILALMQQAGVTEEQLARGRGDPHRLWGDAFVAVSVLGAGAPAALESAYTGALC